MSDPIRCRYVHTEGRQCGSTALRGEKLCYHHHAARRPLARRTDTAIIRPHLPRPEDLHAVQSGIAELLRLISMGHEDDKTHKLLLGTLAPASANLACIERNRRAARTLALAEARFAARHPELAAAHGIVPPPAEESLVTDLVHDPELGSLALGPDPDPRPEGPVPHPTPLVTPAAPGITPEENLANFNAAVARSHRNAPIDLDASAEEFPPPKPGSPRNPFRMLDQPLKSRKIAVLPGTKKALRPTALCLSFSGCHSRRESAFSLPSGDFGSPVSRL